VDRDPIVAWPAPCSPALLEAERRVELLLCHDGLTAEELRAWARDLGLRRRPGGERLTPTVAGVRRIDRRDVGDAARGFADLPERRGRHWTRLALALADESDPRPPRSVALFDLLHGERVVRRGAVAVLVPGATLRLAFASDLHVARIWDDLEAAVTRHAPDLAPRFLHPNRLLARFVERCNRRAAEGELDLVVFGGDLVDHVYTQPAARADRRAAATNVARFADLVATLEVPAVAVPGNHDYRLFPWRARLPTLECVGLPQARVPSLLRASGLWDRMPIRLSDREALRTRDHLDASPLAHHLALLAPATDFALEARGLRLLFASSGRDVLPHWRGLEWRRRSLLPWTLRTSLEHPDSEGLHDHQVERIAAAVAAAPAAAVFFHAPLLHTARPAAIESRVARFELGERDDLAARVAFESSLLRAGVRYGVLYRNPQPLLRALLGGAGPAAAFSGHIHRGTAALVDRRTLAVRSGAMRAPEDARATLPLLTAPSLGQMRDRPEESQPPGFLRARFERGALVELAQEESGARTAGSRRG